MIPAKSDTTPLQTSSDGDKLTRAPMYVCNLTIIAEGVSELRHRILHVRTVCRG
jgi:hypothetical protein